MACSQSRSVAVVTMTLPSSSLRTSSRSITRTISSFFSRSSSGRISPLKRLPGNARLSIWIGPIDSITGASKVSSRRVVGLGGRSGCSRSLMRRNLRASRSAARRSAGKIRGSWWVIASPAPGSRGSFSSSGCSRRASRAAPRAAAPSTSTSSRASRRSPVERAGGDLEDAVQACSPGRPPRSEAGHPHAAAGGRPAAQRHRRRAGSRRSTSARSSRRARAPTASRRGSRSSCSRRTACPASSRCGCS